MVVVAIVVVIAVIIVLLLLLSRCLHVDKFYAAIDALDVILAFSNSLKGCIELFI